MLIKKNLPTELLRSFVTIVDQGGISSAGAIMGRTQPAVSLQLKRLEELLGVTLMQRNGRRLKPTADGQLLLDYARKILQLNDEAIATLLKPQLSGQIRLGIPHEFASSVLPRIIGAFAQTHPNVTLEVSCELSKPLLDKLKQHQLDLVVALHERTNIEQAPDTVLAFSKAPNCASKLWTDALLWIGSANHNSHNYSPLPLIAAPAPCIYRARMQRVLNAAGTPWQIVYTSTSYDGICAAVSAGIGVTVLTKSTIPDTLKVLSTSERFPQLEPVDLYLHYDSTQANDAVLRFVEHIRVSLGAG